MKRKDTPWSGLEKIPEEVVIEQLRKELSEAHVKIGQLESYIDELESKTPTKIALDKYYQNHLRLWEKALLNNDNQVSALKFQKKIIALKLHDLEQKCQWLKNGGSTFVLSKGKSNLLMDVLLYGIAYAEDNDLYSEDMEKLYKNIKSQLK